MLQFEDSSAAATGAARQPVGADRAPALTPEAETELRRVNVADKRVINGSTDVNQLVSNT